MINWNFVKSLSFLFIFISFTTSAQLMFTKYYTGNPVVPKGNLNDWDDSSVWWPNVIFVNDTFYMTYIGTDDFPNSPLSVGLATSADGKNFTKYPDPILEADGGKIESFSVATGPFHIIDSVWYLYYNGISSNVSDPGSVISRAFSASPYGPWTRSSDTLLIVGSSGEWDDAFVIPHSIIEDGEKLVMYYFGGDTWPNPTGQIGMATSTDNGATWEKYEGNPILSPGPENFDNESLFGASVVKTGDRWEMFYSGESSSEMGICYATSKDGINWTKHGVILSPFGDPLAGTFYEGPSIIKNASGYFLYYDYGLQQAGIGLATAERLPGILEVPNMFSTIQEAINVSKAGDTVLVEEGTYFENINFKGKAITVASLFIFDKDTSHISKTIIDGSHNTNPDSGSVVYFISGEDTNSVIIGFTITGGGGTITELEQEVFGKIGGGVLIVESSAKICNNIIRNNIVEHNNIAFGGGLASGPPNFPGFITISKNLIFSNECSALGFAAHSGGINLTISGKIDSNIIIKNSVLSNSGEAFGGGLTSIYSIDSVIISNNIIANNKAEVVSGDNLQYDGALGGGFMVWNDETAFIKIYNNQIYNNEVKGNLWSTGAGGSFENVRGDIQFFNNLVYGNKYDGVNCHGSGISVLDGTEVCLFNNTIVKNEPSIFGGALSTLNTISTLAINNIFWNNSDNNFKPEVNIWEGNEPKIYYSITQGGWEGEGNIDDDPLFSIADPYFRLTSESPCIGTGIDSIEISGKWYHCPSTDLLGNPRPNPIDDYVDIGANESEFLLVAVEENLENVPTEFVLSQNYPNPFNPSTVIKYSIPVDVRYEYQDVRLVVYDILGREVTTIVNQKQKPGNYEVTWDPAADGGWNLSSGVYFYQIQAAEYIETKKMILLR